MIKVIKGKYKNISLRVDYDLNIIVKAPKNTSDAYIQNFVESKKKWLDKQLGRLSHINDIKNTYNFKDNVYLFNEKINFTGNKKEFYENAFYTKILPLARQLAERYKLTYNKITPTNSKRLWGSLNNKKEMKLNWKIVILPKSLVEYIIIHELCHGKEFNHSKKFWDLVSSFIKDYKLRKRDLDKYSFLLKNNLL